MAVPYKPKGDHTATAYLLVNGGAKAIQFYIAAFGATHVVVRTQASS